MLQLSLKSRRRKAKFLSIFTSLEINIPLLEALNKMPTYAQFMRKLVTKNRALECEIIEIPHNCSAILTRHVATKKDDQGTFTIPCTVETCKFMTALCILGTSINLMPLMVFD